jgi:hypothetical protein
MVETVKKEILVFASIYNDWEAASSLLEDLDGAFAFAELPATVTVVFIDDGSTQPAPEAFARGPFRHLAVAGVLATQPGSSTGDRRRPCMGIRACARRLYCPDGRRRRGPSAVYP